MTLLTRRSHQNLLAPGKSALLKLNVFKEDQIHLVQGPPKGLVSQGNPLKKMTPGQTSPMLRESLWSRKRSLHIRGKSEVLSEKVNK